MVIVAYLHCSIFVHNELKNMQMKHYPYSKSFYTNEIQVLTPFFIKIDVKEYCQSKGYNGCLEICLFNQQRIIRLGNTIVVTLYFLYICIDQFASIKRSGNMGYDKHLDFASHCCKIYKCFLRYVKYFILLKFDQNNTLKCFFFSQVALFCSLVAVAMGASTYPPRTYQPRQAASCGNFGNFFF